jgi:hypothetical protein
MYPPILFVAAHERRLYKGRVSQPQRWMVPMRPSYNVNKSGFLYAVTRCIESVYQERCYLEHIIVETIRFPGDKAALEWFGSSFYGQDEDFTYTLEICYSDGQHRPVN